MSRGRGDGDMNAAVKDVMTTHVVAVTKEASFKDVAALLRQHRVSLFPVVDAEGKVIGVVSETDMLPKEALIAGLPEQGPGPDASVHDHNDFVKAIGVTAASIMTTAPITITPRLRSSCRVRSLPVVTENGYLTGIISRADVLSVYGRPDGQIGQEITQDLIATEFGADPGRFIVTVKDGIVTLAGHPDTAQQGRNILAEAWHI